MFLFQGRQYHDDRLFVLYLCRGTIEINADGHIETTIYHDEPPANSHWCLLIYANHTNYPIHSVKHFKTKNEATDYIRVIELETPLISLDGQSSRKPLTHEEYQIWKQENNLEDFSYKKVYTAGGSNHREMIFQTKEQFFKSNPNWPRI